MIEFIGEIFAKIFGTHSALATVIISMFPLVELKGGIPVGMSQDFFGNYALDGKQAFLFAMLGSCLVVPILSLIFTPLIKWLKKTKLFRRLGQMLESKVKTHSDNIEQKTKHENSKTKKIFLKMLSTFAFVAVPLPLTGVWTGTCVAVAIGLNFWQTIVSVVLGNIVAGLIITYICSSFPQFTTILFLIFLAIIAIMLIIGLVKYLIKTKRTKSVIQNTDDENNLSQ